MLLAHLMQGDTVVRVVDHDLVSTAAIDDLLQTECDV